MRALRSSDMGAGRALVVFVNATVGSAVGADDALLNRDLFEKRRSMETEH